MSLLPAQTARMDYAVHNWWLRHGTEIIRVPLWPSHAPSAPSDNKKSLRPLCQCPHAIVTLMDEHLKKWAVDIDKTVITLTKNYWTMSQIYTEFNSFARSYVYSTKHWVSRGCKNWILLLVASLINLIIFVWRDVCFLSDGTSERLVRCVCGRSRRLLRFPEKNAGSR